MKVLFDTNVVLDFLLDRQPFSPTATRLVARVERRELEGFLGATTLTTIHYILARELGRQAALEAVRDLLALFSVAPVDGRILSLAADLALPDFEDAVLHEAARLAGARGIVTRNGDDFKGATLGIDSPDDLEAALAAEEATQAGEASEANEAGELGGSGETDESGEP